MTLYGFIVLLHVIAAVVGIGSSFAMPTILNKATTRAKALWSIDLLDYIEKMAKYGSLALLATGLLLGILNTNLFTQVWYIVSIIIYIAVQPIVAGILPKKIAALREDLAKTESEELSDNYLSILKSTQPLNWTMHTAAIVLIILMSIKPF